MEFYHIPPEKTLISTRQSWLAVDAAACSNNSQTCFLTTRRFVTFLKRIYCLEIRSNESTSNDMR